jgi:hypothetical protein
VIGSSPICSTRVQRSQVLNPVTPTRVSNSECSSGGNVRELHVFFHGEVAQSVERELEELRVGGSIPPFATKRNGVLAAVACEAHILEVDSSNLSPVTIEASLGKL